MDVFKIYESVGRLFSRQNIRKLGSFLEAAGINWDPETFAGFFVIITTLFSILVTLIALQLDFTRGYAYKLTEFLFTGAAGATLQTFVLFITLVACTVATWILAILLAYVFIILTIENRKSKLEQVLPDFLTLAAANVRAGMTVDQALWYSAKPEFGLFSKEVELVARRTLGGEPFNQSLDRLAGRFNSKILNRTIALIKQGMASGGQMAEILERTAEDAREIRMLRKEIGASLIMYVIFIMFAACIGTPFLFAVSSRLVSMLESVFMQLPPVESMSTFGFLKPSPPAISSNDFFLFALSATFVTSVFSSLIIGVIQNGDRKQGIKYIPFMLAIALAFLMLTGSVIGSFLKNIVV